MSGIQQGAIRRLSQVSYRSVETAVAMPEHANGDVFDPIPLQPMLMRRCAEKDMHWNSMRLFERCMKNKTIRYVTLIKPEVILYTTELDQGRSVYCFELAGRASPSIRKYFPHRTDRDQHAIPCHNFRNSVVAILNLSSEHRVRIGILLTDRTMHISVLNQNEFRWVKKGQIDADFDTHEPQRMIYSRTADALFWPYANAEGSWDLRMCSVDKREPLTLLPRLPEMELQALRDELVILFQRHGVLFVEYRHMRYSRNSPYNQERYVPYGRRSVRSFRGTERFFHRDNVAHGVHGECGGGGGEAGSGGTSSSNGGSVCSTAGSSPPTSPNTSVSSSRATTPLSSAARSLLPGPATPPPSPMDLPSASSGKYARTSSTPAPTNDSDPTVASESPVASRMVVDPPPTPPYAEHELHLSPPPASTDRLKGSYWSPEQERFSQIDDLASFLPTMTNAELKGHCHCKDTPVNLDRRSNPFREIKEGPKRTVALYGNTVFKLSAQMCVPLTTVKIPADFNAPLHLMYLGRIVVLYNDKCIAGYMNSSTPVKVRRGDFLLAGYGIVCNSEGIFRIKMSQPPAYEAEE